VSLAAEGPCLIEGGRVAVSGAGTCTISAAQPGDADWAPAPTVRLAFSIARAGQAIALGELADRTYGTEPFDVSARATSGLPVSYQTEGPCRAEGSMIRLTGAGICVVVATQPGDDDHMAASFVRRVFRVERARQVITFGELGPRLLGEPPFELEGRATSGLPVTFVADGPCAIDEATLTLAGDGDCTVTAYQSGDIDWAPAPEIARSFPIVGPLTGRQDLAGKVDIFPPGTLVASGATVTSAFDPGRRTEEYYAIALAAGHVLELERLDGLISWEIQQPGQVAWNALDIDAATGSARWLVEVPGIHSIRVRDLSLDPDAAHSYIIGFDVVSSGYDAAPEG
jgi:hypothetical protein